VTHLPVVSLEPGSTTIDINLEWACPQPEWIMLQLCASPMINKYRHAIACTVQNSRFTQKLCSSDLSLPQHWIMRLQLYKHLRCHILHRNPHPFRQRPRWRTNIRQRRHHKISRFPTPQRFRDQLSHITRFQCRQEEIRRSLNPVEHLCLDGRGLDAGDSHGWRVEVFAFALETFKDG